MLDVCQCRTSLTEWHPSDRNGLRKRIVMEMFASERYKAECT